jgi:hypothetical protein
VTPLVLVLPEDLHAFLDAEAQRAGVSPTAYVAALLRTAHVRAVAARLEALLLAGSDAQAREDIATARRRYETSGLAAIGDRFAASANRALEAAGAYPGEPVDLPNPVLSGLRAWPVKGFSGVHLYGRLRDGKPSVLRLLHHARDVEAFVASPQSVVASASPDPISTATASLRP